MEGQSSSDQVVIDFTEGILEVEKSHDQSP